MADNAAKKVGRFVANEMAGIDDVKRAVSKAKKGDIKGAVKSAATAAVEAGSTVATVGVGGAIGKAIGKKVAESGAKRAAAYAEKRVLETTPAGKLGSKGGKEVTKKVSDKAPVEVTGKNYSKITTENADKVKYTTRERSFKEQLGDAKKQDTKRENKGIDARIDTYNSVKNTSKAPKAGEVTGGAVGLAASAAVKGTQKNHAVTSTDRKTGRAK